MTVPIKLKCTKIFLQVLPHYKIILHIIKYLPDYELFLLALRYSEEVSPVSSLKASLLFLIISLLYKY